VKARDTSDISENINNNSIGLGITNVDPALPPKLDISDRR